MYVCVCVCVCECVCVSVPRTAQYLFIPAKYKDCYLAFVLNEFAGNSMIVFTATCNNTQKCTLMLRNLGFQAVCLHGQMSQVRAPRVYVCAGRFVPCLCVGVIGVPFADVRECIFVFVVVL